MRHILWFITLLIATRLVAQDGDFLPPEQAFKYEVVSDGSTVTVRWTVAPGYYAYKGRMGMSSATPGLQLAPLQFPQGEMHEDDYFGKQEVFRKQFEVTSKLTRTGNVPPEATVQLKIQGCADAGLCYPPQTWDAKFELPANPIDNILGASRAQSGDEFLDPELAFRLEAVADGPDRVQLVWQIADGYYLYRSRLKVATSSDSAQLGQLVLPEGTAHEDEYFGKQEVYYQQLSAALPIARAGTNALELPVDVTYQGCADAGLCYPPITKTMNVSLPAGSGSSGGTAGGFVSEQDWMAEFIRTGNLALVVLAAFGWGLLLSFTPCVLPMVPILSGIIAGSGANVTTRRAFLLSLSYVLGMALTYTLAGALFAAAGKQAQAIFQQAWIIILFAALFIAMGIAMLGAFTVQMPAAIQSRLADISNRQSAGTFGGVAVMGALSALIVTACVAPPLVATLAVIGQSGDVFRGSLTLFAMSLGMGAPLLVVGASAGKLLPKAGAWMDTVKQLFGVMMFGVAAWMLERIAPRFGLLLWAVPVLVLAWILWRAVPRSPRRWIPRTLGAFAAFYGVALLAGTALGGKDLLAPIPQFAAKHNELPFKTIKSVADLQAEVARAKAAGQPVMLDFYADWCVSCKEMEKYTFTDDTVQGALARAVLLRADVTRNDADDQALLKHFGIFGPPTIAFYNPSGQELRNFRVVGYMKAPEFAALVGKALPSS